MAVAKPKITTADLVNAYNSEVLIVIKRIVSEREKAIPFILKTVLLEIVPKMMVHLSQIRDLKGIQKKQMVTDAVILCLNQGFQKLQDLDKRLQKAKWDDRLYEILVLMVPALIDFSFRIKDDESLVFTPLDPGFAYTACLSCIN